MHDRCIKLLASAALGFAASAWGSGDHHMHIYSPDGTLAWNAMCEKMGECGDYVAPASGISGEDAVQVLDEAGLDKGVILSLAYFFGAPELAGGEFDDHRYVRAENHYVADQVSKYPDRLVGFFSVNPVSDYAVNEVRYWAEEGGLVGLKLHLANSDFRFDNPEHMQKLAAVIGVMNEQAMPVVIHLRNRDRNYGYDEAALFIEQIAKFSPAVTFQLAHVGGWGGYDRGTDGAIRAFLDAIERGDLDASRIWFDMAALLDAEESAAVDPNLLAQLKNIGFERILFASDWDEVRPATYLKTLQERLKLGGDRWQQLMQNEAPYLR